MQFKQTNLGYAERAGVGVRAVPVSVARSSSEGSGNLIEMEILRTHPDLTQLETVGGPSDLFSQAL